MSKALNLSEEFKKGELAFIRKSYNMNRRKEISKIRASHPIFVISNEQKTNIQRNPTIPISRSEQTVLQNNLATIQSQKSILNYEKVWDFYTITLDLKKELELVKNDIKTVEISQKSKCGFCLLCCFNNTYPELDIKLQNEREIILAIAKKGHQEITNEIDTNILQIIYSKLTNDKNSEFIKINWEKIGFQNTQNPYTDLRALGMLGPIHILFLVENYLDQAKEIYTFSQQEKIGFPFVLVCFDMTKIAVQALREGILNKIIIAKQHATYVFNIFYITTLFTWFIHWKNNKLEMKDYFFCNKMIIEKARLDPQKHIETLPTLIKNFPIS